MMLKTTIAANKNIRKNTLKPNKLVQCSSKPSFPSPINLNATKF